MIVLDLLRRLWFFFFDRFVLYPLISWLAPKLGVTFMNLGFWPMENEEKLQKVVEHYAKDDDLDKPHYYLYEKPLSLHPEYPSLRALSLLEVACGQGAGLKWMERAHPFMREAVGLDRMAPAYTEQTILPGDAENMPFEGEEFDIVLSVEASHLFSNCLSFFREAYRVLAAGGHLCWIDLRYSHQVHLVREQAVLAGFTEVYFEDVTPQVLQGIDKTAARYDRLLTRAPAFVKLFSSSLRATYCAPGTHTHARFVSGEKKYLVAMWKKQ